MTGWHQISVIEELATAGSGAANALYFTGRALLAAVLTEPLQLYDLDGSPEAMQCRRQLELARVAYRDARTMQFDIDPAEGHDDYLISLALCVDAAGHRAAQRDRTARGRVPAGGGRMTAPPVTPAHTAPRKPREDALPELLLRVGRYRDDGCDLFAACLTCPLPRCRYDVAGGARTMLNEVRDDEIRRLRRDGGVAVDEIARRFRVSRRTVFRVLQRGVRPIEVAKNGASA